MCSEALEKLLQCWTLFAQQQAAPPAVVQTPRTSTSHRIHGIKVAFRLNQVQIDVFFDRLKYKGTFFSGHLKTFLYIVLDFQGGRRQGS